MKSDTASLYKGKKKLQDSNSEVRPQNSSLNDTCAQESPLGTSKDTSDQSLSAKEDVLDAKSSVSEKKDKKRKLDTSDQSTMKKKKSVQNFDDTLSIESIKTALTTTSKKGSVSLKTLIDHLAKMKKTDSKSVKKWLLKNVSVSLQKDGSLKML